ncbi:MAG: class I SAM-dependent methyltransferase [Nitrosomonadales bacterium]|nr:class I SAM-dependent methyltransferase [Nitrosomonadales bacterium]
MPLLHRIPPVVLALLLQGLALFLVLLLARFSPVALTPLIIALLVGALAALFSHLAGQARWWVPIQFVFAPAQVAMLAVDVAPSLYLVIFLIMLVVYWSTFRTQVPLYLSSRKIWNALELLLPLEMPGKSFTFMDLGCGIGGVLTHLAKARPEGHYHGVEAAPLPYFMSWLRIRLGNHQNCQVQWGSLWDCDLAQYDVVFAYLSPVPMDELWQKARKEMRPGSIFISNTFAVPEHPPQQTYTVDDLHKSTLYIWHM